MAYFITTNFLIVTSILFIINIAVAVDSSDHHTINNTLLRNYSSEAMDDKYVVTFEDMQKIIKDSSKYLIDVREPEEFEKGNIPTSILIPLKTLRSILEKSDEEFKNLTKRNKPTTNDVLVFYCQSGRRATQALEEALKLGYKNSLVYRGSWGEWTSKGGEVNK